MVKSFQLFPVDRKSVKDYGKDYSLKGLIFGEKKVASVKGATGALGRVVTKMLHEHRAKVVASYRTKKS